MPRRTLRKTHDLIAEPAEKIRFGPSRNFALSVTHQPTSFRFLELNLLTAESAE